jgi:hypothetical protein
MALQLIRFMLSYNIYIKYSKVLEFIIKDNKELTILYNYLDKLHNKYQRDLTVTEYSLFVLVNCQEKDKENLAVLLKDMADVDTQSVVLEDTVKDIQQRQQAYDLAVASLEVSEGRKEFTDLLVLAGNLNATKSDSDSSESIFVTHNLEELYNDSIQTVGLRWRLQTLNRMLGSLRRGDFGFIFARPETGKTTFLASEVTHFATQLHGSVSEEPVGPIIWFNNEEQGSKVQLRLYQAMLGCTLGELFSDIPTNRSKYLERGGDKIQIYDSASIHRRQVEQIVHELKPSLVIFDQIDKVKGFTDDREDLRLGSIYIWAREIAKQYCPVIGVSQSDASGEGKRWLTMENVANAKTAKQAEADWILGIGKTHDTSEEYMRHLHLCKNKLTGDTDTVPDMRHGKQTVRINAEVARYEDIE